MALRSPVNAHNFWGEYSTTALLPGVPSAEGNLQTGDTAYVAATSSLYVCTDKTPGSVVWTEIGSGGGITELTQDVLAGPGSGSQAATVQGMGGATTKTHFVIEGGAYATLQAAVDAASANDVIMVGPKATGDWGNVLLNVVNKPLTIAAVSGAGANKIVAVGSVTYDLGTSGPALNVSLNETYLTGLYIQGSFAGGSAVTLTGGANYPGRLRLYGCYVLNSSATGAAAVTNSNQGSASSLYLDACVVSLTPSAAGSAIVQSSGYTVIRNRCDVSGSLGAGATGNAIRITGGTMEIYDSYISVSRAVPAISITGGTTFVSAGYSTILSASNAAGASAVSIGTAGATFGAGDATLAVGVAPGPAAGSAVTGVAGGLFIYGNVTYSYSTTISTVTAIPVTQQAATGDLSGNYPAPTVARLRGSAISATAPSANGQALVWNGTAWAPSTAPSATGQVLVWNGTAWSPTASGSIQASGIIDVVLNGSAAYLSPTVVGTVYIPSARTLAASSRARLGISGASQTVTLQLQNVTSLAIEATFSATPLSGFADVTLTSGGSITGSGWYDIVLTAATAGTAFARGLYLTV